MIKVTRFNTTHVLAVNADLIELVEASPDTMITLVNGKKLLVRETLDEVITKVVEYRKEVGPLIVRPLPEEDGLQEETG
ncbi:MAG: flagellar FlbD family protein [Armatimonadetes bacterium]|nr:flagellar FlbD family protein [Armatimonadota bacterium]